MRPLQSEWLTNENLQIIFHSAVKLNIQKVTAFVQITKLTVFAINVHK